MKYIFVTAIFFTLLSGCSSGPELMKNPNGSYSSSAQYGSINGSWERASREVYESAEQSCRALNLKLYVHGEQRTGVFGYSPQKSTITYSCEPDIDLVLARVVAQCDEEIALPELDNIRIFIDLSRRAGARPPSIEQSTNNKYPNKFESVSILNWAKILERCNNRITESLDLLPKPSSQMQIALSEKQKSFRDQRISQLNSLIVALYQGKLTYGEFAQKRHEIASIINNAENDYKTLVLIQDRESQIKAEQLALQQQQNSINAWNSYLQTVNSRPIRLQTNCITNKIGNTLTTNCN
jgi:hypothetical protein